MDDLMNVVALHCHTLIFLYIDSGIICLEWLVGSGNFVFVITFQLLVQKVKGGGCGTGR